MLSRRDLKSAEFETTRVSESPTTVVTANGEVQTEEEAAVFVNEVDLFVFSKIHRQFFHLENSAKITDTATSGPVVRNHNSLKMADEYNAARKIRTDRCLWFIDWLFQFSYT